jgi:hypothetical protein
MAWGENEIAMRANGGSANLQNADTCMNSLSGELSNKRAAGANLGEADYHTRTQGCLIVP